MSEKIMPVSSTPDENIEKLTKNKAVHLTGTMAERKTLQTLQLSADGKLTGSQHRQSPDKKRVNKITASKKPLTVYTDKKSSPVETGVQTDKQDSVETSAQTEVSGASGLVSVGSDLHNDSGICHGDADQEAYNLMVRDEIPASYWRDLAEERRLSLAEALSENETLHQSMEEMKEENHNLSLLASQAEYFANMLNNVLNDSKTEETDNDNDSKKPADDDEEKINNTDGDSKLHEEKVINLEDKNKESGEEETT